MKRLALLLALAWVSQASITVVTIADISGDGSAHAIATSGSATWIQFVAPSANSAAVRIGDANITTSRGISIAAGGGMFLPAVTRGPFDNQNSDTKYSLPATYYLIQSGDKLSITYAP